MGLIISSTRADHDTYCHVHDVATADKLFKLLHKTLHLLTSFLYPALWSLRTAPAADTPDSLTPEHRPVSDYNAKQCY